MEFSVPYSQESAVPKSNVSIRNKLFFFYGEELLAPHPAPKLEKQPFSYRFTQHLRVNTHHSGVHDAGSIKF